MIAESPRKRSCTAASRLALAIPQLAYEPGCRHSPAGGAWGVKEDKWSMLQSLSFRRSLVALALCSAAIAASATPASARSHHGEGRHVHGRHAAYHASRHYGHRHYRHIVRASRWERGVAQMQARGFADTRASFPSSAAAGGMAMSGGSGSSDVL